ncbi:MAG: response regulator [Saprospiraceae bacterium]|nr:response regulator [Saprospiraceae bacterium]MBK8370466.1 response regulator [Saprospiraceae bacterium]MBK8546611.1 response regulator [Saprospiraceae bacterium]MBK8817737.1 response regulator [Saprospiraceae bacterium]MBK8854680.1 response regulator [Saprospiraceae bacterium]
MSEQKTILVIEDNANVRENLEEILILAGYKVFAAENGKTGVTKAQEHVPDLILCDIMMPELDGYGVLRILGSQPKTSDIPFIFLTAKTEREDFRKGMGLGADDYITKPFDDVELLDTIEMRLQKSVRIKKSFDNTETGLQKFIDEAKAQKEFEKLSENRELRKYNKKDPIYEAGQYPKWLYFVAKGRVKCFQINDFGKELITHIFSEGDFFGYVPLLRNEKYQDSTVSLDDCELRLIPIDDFTMLLFNNREFAAKFIKMLANQTEEVEKNLIDLAYSSVRKRVSKALIKFNESNKNKNMYILRDDIASLAGTAKETVIRTLSDFKSEGLISIEDNRITILQLEKLINMPQ